MFDARQLLKKEILRRRLRNSSYSLRAFARDLGVSPTALSQYLSHQRDLSPRNKRSVVSRLGLSPHESSLFFEKAGALEPRKQKTGYDLLDDDAFRLIADWVSVAVLNLARLKKNSADAGWIARRLNIAVEEARDALGRLERSGLVVVKEGRMVRTRRPFATTTDVPSAAIQRYHTGVLHKAEQALLHLPVEARDITAITMPADPQRLEEAKKILRRTRRRISELLATDKADSVFILSCQLFPLTQPNEVEDPSLPRRRK